MYKAQAIVMSDSILASQRTAEMKESHGENLCGSPKPL